MPDIFTSENEKETPEQPDEQSRAQSSRPSIAEQLNIKKSKTAAAPVKVVRHTKEETPHKSHMNPLAAYAVDPSDVFFATQGKDEQVHLFLRKHFITNVPWIIFGILLFLIPPIFAPFLGNVFPFLSFFSPNISLILLAFYYIVVFGTVIFTSFINWYFNVYIVTNERVIDVDFVNILYKEVSATRINLIQDVTTKAGGIVAALFDYGDVFVQTAGTEVNFDFHAVPHPQKVAQEIEKLMEQARKQEGVSELEKQLER